MWLKLQPLASLLVDLKKHNTNRFYPNGQINPQKPFINKESCTHCTFLTKESCTFYVAKKKKEDKLAKSAQTQLKYANLKSNEKKSKNTSTMISKIRRGREGTDRFLGPKLRSVHLDTRKNVPGNDPEIMNYRLNVDPKVRTVMKEILLIMNT